jgi:hypothetical protein
MTKSIRLSYFLCSILLAVVLGACAWPLLGYPTTPDSMLFPGAAFEIDQWNLHVLSFDAVEFYAPVDWVVEEMHWSSAVDVSGSRMIDCSGYIVSNLDGSIQLWIKPPCGFSKPAPSGCEKDGVIVKQGEGNAFILRWFDVQSGFFRYSDAYVTTITSGASTRQELICANPPLVVLSGEKNVTFVEIELKYSGSEAGQNLALEIVDRIVTSFRRGP